MEELLSGTARNSLAVQGERSEGQADARRFFFGIRRQAACLTAGAYLLFVFLEGTPVVVA